MKAPRKDAAKTRESVLAAASEVFVEKGYRDATIAEICERAGANVAAVNYHFGDKERLYIAVLRESHLNAIDGTLGLNESAPAEERLTSFIGSFLHHVLDEGSAAIHGRLMLRELADPTSALDALVESDMRPKFEALSGIIREILGKGARREIVSDCAASIIGQCAFHCLARPVLARLAPHISGPGNVDGLADHITRFSLAALRRIAQDMKKGGR